MRAYSMRVVGVLVAMAALLATEAAAQRPPTPNDTLVSPEVLPDRRVTFRLYAPKASEVTLRGDWMDGPGTVALTKDAQGVWSATVGPLGPDFYSYTLTVDGVRTLDPKNPTIKQGIASVDNMVWVPGPEAAFQDLRAVPHGEIRQIWYSSKTLGQQRRMHVYTPPGYDTSGETYPVFYLLHGGGDDDSGWSTIGRAGLILDNLIADGKAKPMIVVMPNGSLPRPADAPRAGLMDPAFRERMEDRFTRELMQDVIPTVERRFRVVAEPASRAIAGLSMGGGQTLRVIAAHPDQFRYAAIWSMGVPADRTAEFERRAAAFLKDAETINRSYAVLDVTIGDRDFLLEAAKNLSAVLTKHGIEHAFEIGTGGHTWINWRQYLHRLAPRLFKGDGGQRGTGNR
ncbi:MAG TPA: alpha/beta hydrolase-fold protein [Vicinamibacterales bacterium]